MADNEICFVIMPFGHKATPDGQVFDFDDFYQNVICRGITQAGLTPVRCDDIQKAGSIHDDMFMHIATDRAVLVELTTLNPNVFYELGVRHALRNNITILIKRADFKNAVPFNISGLRVIEYGCQPEGYPALEDSIATFIRNGLQEKTRTDSPVKLALDRIRQEDKTRPITELNEFEYHPTRAPQKSIRILTGEVQNWTGIDVWVNSENTFMQMARFSDRSFSAVVRYLGAKKDETGTVVEDTIATELTAKKAGREDVPAGQILVTTSGALAETHGVKKIFHIAATVGTPGRGWRAIPEIQDCIYGALRRMEAENKQGADLRTIAFPMLGTGIGGLNVYEVAPRLIDAAVAYLGATRATTVQQVSFLAWNGRDFEACTAAVAAAMARGDLEPGPPAADAPRTAPAAG